MPATVDKNMDSSILRVRRGLLTGLTAFSVHAVFGAAGGLFRRLGSGRAEAAVDLPGGATAKTAAVGADSFQVKPPVHSVKRRG